MSIRVIDRETFELYGEIDDFKSFLSEHMWHEVGSFTIRIDEKTLYADMLQEDRIIFEDPKKPYIITDRGNTDIDGVIEIQGYQLKRILGERTIVPPDGTTHDRKTDNAEAVMKHYVDGHALNPVEAGRAIPQLSMSANQNRGPVLAREARYKNLLTELIEISKISGLGFDVTLDIENKRFLFEVYEGTDRTQNQSAVPPILFTTIFDNVISQEFRKSQANYKNFAIVAWQGTGENRLVTEVWTTVDKPTGLDRREVFIDASDISATNDDKSSKTQDEIIAALQEEGKQKLLTDYALTLSFTMQVKDVAGMVYENDWFIGDLVSAQELRWGIEMDTRIIGVTEVKDEQGRRIEAVFSNTVPTFKTLVQRELSQLSNLLRN